MDPILYLASASPRRRELLRQIGVPHITINANVDETAQAGEAPYAYVQRIARAKALAVWTRHPGPCLSDNGPGPVPELDPGFRRDDESRLPVLAADTVVVLDGIIYGKPRDRAHAIEMLTHLSGRTHEVLTAVALAGPDGIELRMNVSSVKFRVLSAEQCAAYWDTGEPQDKAGAYAIQGFAAVFIESLSGSYSGVMGLPLYETAQLLRCAGLALWCKMDP